MRKILRLLAIIGLSAVIFASCASSRGCDCSRWANNNVGTSIGVVG